ncbi:hypothetical protein Mapa_012608 [Marchantia paleacea]|nr:hypothetical protein Mapa_012608 [Marchantia paleacea]
MSVDLTSAAKFHLSQGRRFNSKGLGALGDSKCPTEFVKGIPARSWSVVRLRDGATCAALVDKGGNMEETATFWAAYPGRHETSGCSSRQSSKASSEKSFSAEATLLDEQPSAFPRRTDERKPHIAGASSRAAAERTAGARPKACSSRKHSPLRRIWSSRATPHVKCGAEYSVNPARRGSS